MKKVNSLLDIKENFSLTIGNFDGLHLGHIKLINNFLEESRKRNLKTCVLSFSPHPYVVFNKDKDHLLLLNNEEKVQKLSKLQIDYYYEIPFDLSLSQMKGNDFFKKYILVNPNFKLFYEGYDFSLGDNKSFTGEDVLNLLCNYDFERLVESPLFVRDVRISSTLIRETLKEGDVKLASTYLGYNYTLKGLTLHGEKQGRKINFPTINLSIDKNKVLPKIGVYKTLVTVSNQKFMALTNIGKKPTAGDFPINIESFLLNFSKETYGESIEVEFIDFIREEKKFENFEALRNQISLDLIKAWPSNV